MNSHTSRYQAARSNRLRLFGVIVMVLLLVPLARIPQPQVVQAEGSKDLVDNGGNRPYTEYRTSNNPAVSIAGIQSKTVIFAYVANGETLHLGSSVMMESPPPASPGTPFGGAEIQAIPPDGSAAITFASGGGCGHINDPTEEAAGPVALAAGGYTSCVINVASVDQEGIWEIHFVSPQPTTTSSVNGAAPDPWTGQNTTDGYVTAWDVTVANGTTPLSGRVFANYLALNLGGNNLALNSVVYILTNDGALYEVDLNGLDPYAVIFFANNKGFTDKDGNPIYRSLQFVDNSTNFGELPADFDFHNPADDNDEASFDFTHKIFFNKPASTRAVADGLPDTAKINDGAGKSKTVNLFPEYQELQPIKPEDFHFVGREGTPDQLAKAPDDPAQAELGGNFIFPSNVAGANYIIRIDVDQDGIFGNNDDPILAGVTNVGENTKFWNGRVGRDSGGDPAPPGLAYNASIEFHTGEVHFPFFDAESHPRGFIIERQYPVIAGESAADLRRIYYDDGYYYDGTGDYDYSICANGDTPAPPASADVAKPRNNTDGCYGMPPAPINVRDVGLDSQGGAHTWSDTNGDPQATGFGNLRGIDTWTYIPTNPVYLEKRIAVKEADLQIQKTGRLEGGSVVFELMVTNDGPSDAIDATVIDIMPAELADITWECAITSGTGNCDETEGTGDINTTVDLENQAVATFTIRGRPTQKETIRNVARVERPDDVYDPNDTNDDNQDSLDIPEQADLSLSKVVDKTDVAVGDNLVFTIEITNAGPADATGVEVTDDFPTGLVVVSSNPAQGSYDESSGVWEVGSLAAGTSTTLQITARVDDEISGINRAQVSASDQPDYDSTPNNMVGSTPNEDDEAIATFTSTRGKVADLELDKIVRPQEVAPGGVAIFTIRLTNNGPDEATNVQIQDRLPRGLEYLDDVPSQGSYDPSSGLWDVGAVASGTSVTLDLAVRVTGSNDAVNSAEVTASDQDDPDSTPGNDDPLEDDQDNARLRVAAPPQTQADLSLNKKLVQAPVDVGDTVVFSIELTNAGPATATGVEVAERLPAGLVYVSDSPSQGSYNDTTSIWNVGRVESGETVTLQLTTRLESADGVRNVAEVSASDQRDPDSVPNNQNPREDDQDEVTVRPVARLNTTKHDTLIDDKDGNGAPSAGDTVQYEIVFENISSTTARDVRFTDVPDANTSLVVGSVQTDRGTVTEGNTSGDTDVAITIGDVPPNAQVTITFNVVIDDPLAAGVRQIANQGVVTGSNITAHLTDDPNTVEERDPTITPLVRTPLLDAFKRDVFDAAVHDNDGDGVPSPGDTLRYEITIANTGNADARDVVFTDRPDANTSLVVGSVQTDQGTVTTGNASGDTTITVALGTIAVDTSVTISFDVRIADPLPAGVLGIANQGIISGANVPTIPTDDPDTPTDDDPTTTPVVQQPRLDAFKHDVLLDDNNGDGIPSPGDTLVYVITLVNTGNSDAEDVVFTDIPDINTTLVLGSVKTSQGSVEEGNTPGDSAVRVEIGTLAAGTQVDISYTVAINDPLSPRVTRIVNQGIFTGSNVPSIPTDDPDTALDDDPTVTPLTNTPILDASKRSNLLRDNDGDGTPSAGDTIAYTIKLRNNGYGTATNVVFEDQPDIHTTLVPGSIKTDQGTVTSGNSAGDETITIDIGDIGSGGVVTIGYEVTINDPLPEDMNEVANQGIVTGDDISRTPTYDPLTPDNKRQTITMVGDASRINASKVDLPVNDNDGNRFVSQGDTIVYAITISNHGNEPATSVVFNDTIDTNATLVVGSVRSDQGTVVEGNSEGDTAVQIDIGTLAPGASIDISFEVRVNDTLPSGTNALFNQGIVTTDDPPTTIVTDDPDKPNDDDVTETPLTAIDIIKQVEPARVVPNQPATYRLIVRNLSNEIDFSVVSVTDTLPDGLTYIPGSATPFEPEVQNGQLTWADLTGGEPFRPGETIEITFEATASDSGTKVNTAVVTGDYPGGTVTDDDSTDLFVVDPGVLVNKFAVTPNFVSGFITFTIQITNTGESTLDVVPLLDSFFGPIEYVGGNVTPDEIDNEGQVLRWNDLTQTFGDMRPGDVYTIDTVFQLTEEVPQGRTEIENTAVVRDATDTFGNVAPPSDDPAIVIDSTPTAIDLLSFTALRQSQGIDIRWTTGLERNTWGFHLWRSSDGTRQNAERITTELILARGIGTISASYSWLDTSVPNTGRYTYWLQEIELDGTTIDYGPVTSVATVQSQTSIFMPLIQRQQ